MSRFRELTRDPLRVNAFLIVFAFGSMFILPSQTTSSLATYPLALAMLFGARRWRAAWSDPIVLLTAALLGYLALSALWSDPEEPGKGLSITSRALLTFLFVVALAECSAEPLMTRWFGRVLVVAGALAAAAAIVVFLVTNPEDGRLNGLGQLGAHVIAGLMFGVVLIVLLDGWLSDTSSRWRVLAGVCGTVLALAILLTASRNAWVSVLLGLTVFGAAHRFGHGRRFIAGVCVMASGFALLGLGVLLSDELRAWALPRGDSFRPLIWSTILNDVWNHGIVFGRGILTADDVQNGPVLHPHPHSMYLAVLYQGGLVALGLFLVLTALVLRSLYRYLDAPEAKVALAILAIALPSYVLDGHELVDRIGETWLLFWLPVGLCLGLRWRGGVAAPGAARDSSG